MNPWRWVDPRVESVRLADVQAYFRQKGWTTKPERNPNFVRFIEPSSGGRPFYYVFLSSDHFADFRMRTVEMITTFSELEDRHPVEILNDILQCGAEAEQRNGAQTREDAEAINPQTRKRKRLKGTTTP